MYKNKNQQNGAMIKKIELGERLLGENLPRSKDRDLMRACGHRHRLVMVKQEMCDEQVSWQSSGHEQLLMSCTVALWEITGSRPSCQPLLRLARTHAVRTIIWLLLITDLTIDRLIRYGVAVRCWSCEKRFETSVRKNLADGLCGFFDQSIRCYVVTISSGLSSGVFSKSNGEVHSIIGKICQKPPVFVEWKTMLPYLEISLNFACIVLKIYSCVLRRCISRWPLSWKDNFFSIRWNG